VPVLTVTERKRANNPHQPVGRWIIKKRRLAIYLRDGFCCVLCGVDLSTATERDITLDHHEPRHLGGGNASDNLYTACCDCNQKIKHEQRTRAQIQRVERHLDKPMDVFLNAAYVITEMRES
jgi:5-methylcytosine-specific restriction endonuclease McrA